MRKEEKVIENPASCLRRPSTRENSIGSDRTSWPTNQSNHHINSHPQKTTLSRKKNREKREKRRPRGVVAPGDLATSSSQVDLQ